MYNSEFWLNLHGIWDGWPFREVEGVFKWYYLAQWAFYIQQILVVNIEEKRKDFAQMLTHHIFTTALLFLSYGYYHMRVGLVIMCTMDFVDIILPVSLRSGQDVGEVARADKDRPQSCSSTWATLPLATLPLAYSLSHGLSLDTSFTWQSAGPSTTMPPSTWHLVVTSHLTTPRHPIRHILYNRNFSYPNPTPHPSKRMVARTLGAIY
jgi:hypothetical protein